MIIRQYSWFLWKNSFYLFLDRIFDKNAISQYCVGVTPFCIDVLKSWRHFQSNELWIIVIGWSGQKLWPKVLKMEHADISDVLAIYDKISRVTVNQILIFRLKKRKFKISQNCRFPVIAKIMGFLWVFMGFLWVPMAQIRVDMVFRDA